MVNNVLNKLWIKIKFYELVKLNWKFSLQIKIKLFILFLF